ncbi:MAG TPA: guanylate kinase [Candidatus Fimimorpha faecalis]|uniref:Guanylate kinase n=1 Tax=Candidatus Fimimorpha faecalis TaxID=2840824 RepID=A0A9D1JCJ7_9FIRM|nr:guanylate kinase [Candidatus Fimimorpha faecalis]
MGKIFYIMGKSAVGKDRIYSVLRRDKELNLKNILLYTTRPIRKGERDGVDYYFIDEEQIQMFQKEEQIIEMRSYQTVHGIWRYLTVNDGQFQLEQQSCIMIGTLESYEKMKQYFGSSLLVPIYVKVDDGIRLERALKREREQENPKYSELCRRYLADEKDFSQEKLKASGISNFFENNNFEVCIAQIKQYIKTEMDN